MKDTTVFAGRDRIITGLFASGLSCLFIVAAGAAEPELRTQDLKRFCPTAPDKAVQTIQLRPGMMAQLAACEPLVASPVGMAFDEDNHLFVVEMIDYPERPLQKLGRIRMLTDTDGDGTFDKATIYAKDMAWPTGVIPWDGGIFVLSTPDVLYFKDTDGDGVADVRQVALTGFGMGTEKLNMQGLMNTMIWGLDNRIHNCSGYQFGTITSPARPANSPLNLRKNKGFVFDPRSLVVQSEHGGGQWGISFDTAGRLYTCSNSKHVQVFAWDDRYADLNPNYHLPTALADIPVDGPACEVFRISPEEPWRIIRTRWRVAGTVTGLIEGGGRPSGYITSACGILIYTGNALGPDFAGDAFVCEPAGNLITRKKLTLNGAIPSARRAPGEERTEFLASRDTWWRPVYLSNGPDGALWVVDMYREYVEHPWSLPPNLKKLMDLDSGAERGRIWRIVPERFKTPPAVRMNKATTAELVQLLAHPNGWHRETASRLLYQRQDRLTIEPLRKLLRESPPPGALHALCALDGLAALEPADIVAALNRPNDPNLHLNALKLAEKLPDPAHLPQDLQAAIARLADASAPVKQQLALTLGKLPHPQKVQILARIARSDPKDPWIRSALLAAVQNSAGDLFADLATDQAWLGKPESRELARELLRQLAIAQPREPSLAAARRIAALQDDDAALEFAAALGHGMQQAKVSLASTEPGAALVKRARAVAQSSTAPPPTRIAAIEMLSLLPFADASADILARLAAGEPEPVQLAAVGALDRWAQDDIATPLIARWRQLTPAAREAALSMLIKRPARARVLLSAIAANTVNRADLTATHLAALRQNKEPAIREQVAKLFATVGARRQEVVDKFLPSVELKGDRERGRKFFKAQCAQCHRIAGEGNALGPDLETVRDWPREKFLVSLLDPNRDILPAYMAFIVETTDGEQHVGLLVTDSAASITLKMAGNKQVTVTRDDIASIRSANLSMMPEGQEKDMKPQDFADLMEFVLPGK